MTGTCTLCGATISVDPDNILDAQRDERTVGKFGAQLRHHLDRFHNIDPLQHMEEAGLLPVPQMIGIIGICAQMVAVQSFFESPDPVFLNAREKLLGIVTRSMQPKKVNPSVLVPGSG